MFVRICITRAQNSRRQRLGASAACCLLPGFGLVQATAGDIDQGYIDSFPFLPHIRAANLGCCPSFGHDYFIEGSQHVEEAGKTLAGVLRPTWLILQ